MLNNLTEEGDHPWCAWWGEREEMEGGKGWREEGRGRQRKRKGEGQAGDEHMKCRE